LQQYLFSMNCICSFHEINLSVIGAVICFFHVSVSVPPSDWASIALGANALFWFYLFFIGFIWTWIWIWFFTRNEIVIRTRKVIVYA
jgi:hypothetical protein